MQGEIISSILDGKDTFVLMPTGGGKSICFQIPATCVPGVCLVVSPLIALMRDQVDGLRRNGISAAYLNSSQSMDEQEYVENQLMNGELKLLYVSPEKLLSPTFSHLLEQVEVSFFAIDEAHCISQWGHDFRPEYTKLSILRKRYPKSPIMALTASADKTTMKDIMSQLHLKKPEVFQ